MGGISGLNFATFYTFLSVHLESIYLFVVTKNQVCLDRKALKDCGFESVVHKMAKRSVKYCTFSISTQNGLNQCGMFRLQITAFQSIGWSVFLASVSSGNIKFLTGSCHHPPYRHYRTDFS